MIGIIQKEIILLTCLACLFFLKSHGFRLSHIVRGYLMQPGVGVWCFSSMKETSLRTNCRFTLTYPLLRKKYICRLFYIVNRLISFARGCFFANDRFSFLQSTILLLTMSLFRFFWEVAVQALLYSRRLHFRRFLFTLMIYILLVGKYLVNYFDKFRSIGSQFSYFILYLPTK